MKISTVLLLLCFISAGALAQEQPILVTPQWLKEHQMDPNLILLQVTSLKFEYDKEHIAVAQYLWPGSLAPDSPYGSFNLPDTKTATDILQGFGINKDSHVILYHLRNEISVTARMFLTLEDLGLRGRVSFLNGGMDQWKKAGFTTTTEVPINKKGKFRAMPGSIIVSKEQVLSDLNRNSGVIVDARIQRFYDGEPTGNPRDGHITGAKNIPYTEMVDATNLFKPVDQLQAYFTPAVSDKSKEVVVYCFIGQTASVVYMAGRVLGYDMKLYDGSMQEWSRIESLPMEVTKK